MTNDEEYARGDETSWQVLRMGKKTTKLLREQRSKQSRKKDRYYYRTWKTDAPCCGSFRTTGGCGGLWPSLFVVDDDMLPLFVLLLPAGDVVLLLSPARSIPIICSFVQREYNSNIYLLECVCSVGDHHLSCWRQQVRSG